MNALPSPLPSQDEKGSVLDWMTDADRELQRLINIATRFIEKGATHVEVDARITFYYQLCNETPDKLAALLALPECQRDARIEMLFTLEKHGLIKHRDYIAPGKINGIPIQSTQQLSQGEDDSGTLEPAFIVSAGLTGEEQVQNTRLQKGRPLLRYKHRMVCPVCTEERWGKGTRRQVKRDVTEYIDNDSVRLGVCGHVRSRYEKDGRLRRDVQESQENRKLHAENKKYDATLKQQAIDFVLYKLAWGPKPFAELVAAGKLWEYPKPISEERMITALKNLGIPLAEVVDLPAHLREEAQHLARLVDERLAKRAAEENRLY
jgi:hypothetical protein